jgi:hypothetical protein
MARDPAAYRSPSTGLRADRWVLESGAQSLRVRVPAALAATTTLTAAGTMVPVSIDSASGGKYARRLVSLSGGNGRPQSISVTQGTERVTWTQLFAAGAETGDASWSPPGFAVDSAQRYAGRAAYRLSSNLELRSPLLPVPATTDTVSLNFWTRFNGDGYSQSPFGLVRVSTDSGRTWDVVARMAGAAVEWYPEDVRIGGVRGKALTLSFLSSNLPWWLDEITLFSHGAKGADGGGTSTSLRLLPSANPVRGSAVTFVWPYAGREGRLRVYDFTGRLVWTHDVRAGAIDATWNLGAQLVPNGAYLVLAESGESRTRLKLFVAREMP